MASAGAGLLPLLLVLAFLLFAGTAQAQITIPGQQSGTQPSTAASPAPSVDDLIRLLENDQARAELIARLRAVAEGEKGQTAEAVADPTFARHIAEYTQMVAEQGADAMQAIGGILAETGRIFAGSTRANFSRLWNVIGNVALVGLALVGAFMVVRIITGHLTSGIAARAPARGWLGRTMLLIAAILIESLGVIVAWAAGYVVALNVVGGTGRMGINQSLLLNAFLAVELVKVLLRALLEPDRPALRLAPLSDTTATYWYFWASRIVSMLGYTFMFVAPIIAASVSFAAAQAIRILVVLTIIIMAVIIVLQNRDRVRAVLSQRAAAGRDDVLSRSLAFLGRYWHILAIVYLVGLFLAWLANPDEALPYIVGATAESVVAAAVGAVVITFIARFVSVGMRLPPEVKERLPLLERRLNAFVPRTLQVVRTIVLVAVLIAIAQAWGLIDFIGWVASDVGRRVTGSVISAALIVLVGFAIYLAVSSWVEYRLNPNYGTVPTARERTLLALFRNAFTIALCVLVLMLALAQLGVNIAPLLAGAGVLGLAIGFGAQKLVQDIITGVFIQFENAMNEGDVVTVGNFSGVVERLTIRSVSIRSLDGTLHLVPFSSVDSVSNMTKGFSYHIAEIGVAYREDIAEVKEAMQDAFDQLLETEHKDHIIGPLEMHGVTAFGDSAVMVRARIKTMPGQHWAIGRTYNELIKQIFDARGIEIPFPHITLYMGEDKQGKAPPLNVKELPRPSSDQGRAAGRGQLGDVAEQTGGTQGVRMKRRSE
ncbi:mechanosensitive ion channel domain-containing protein [Rhodoligotrophos defluvii]|uniref:mechanosensitive ion channel domain-containing protein n=1 Tax=Rhodoligotrophos defluvii TaxID=2561934 RepID=UPI0010C9F244|nr:mechanosensitive ion channel domain-containing protein [Rhodoligotrophos defluvii]